MDMLLLLGLCIGYLCGSVSAAIITCKVLGLADPRTTGSGNPGATNVLRVGGKKAAAITLVGDMFKGLLPILIMRVFTDDITTIALTGFAAFLGHLYPLFFQFKGGKGVATALGALVGYSWICGLMAMGTWLLASWLFKISSLAALITFALAPIYLYIITGHSILALFMIAISALLFWRHKANIQRILSGTEDKIGHKKG